MIPHGDRSIRNIPVSPNHRRAPVTVRHPAPTPRQQEEVYEEELLREEEAPREPHTPMHTPRAPRQRNLLWIGGAVLVSAVLALFVANLFEQAIITATPRTAAVDTAGAFTASLNATDGALAYSAVSVTRSATTTVKAEGTKQVSKQASGTATIYNNFGTAPQRLIANTRFEAPDGKIYRIRSSVTVPGAKKNADGSQSAGSITATLYADSPGAEYNRGQTTFTIPGFKGDPRYSKFYADTKGITGGMVGTVPSVAPSDLAAAQAKLKQEVEASVREAAVALTPNDSLKIQEGLTVSFGELVQTVGENGTATLSQEATATQYIVSTKALGSAIAKQKVEKYDGTPVTIADPSKLTITLGSGGAKNTITVNVTGTALLVWQFDEAALKTAILGKDKTTFKTTVQSFQPALVVAEARIRPFWKTVFPSNPKDIRIDIVLPK